MSKPAVLGVRLSTTLGDRVAAEAARRGVSASALVREILTEYFVSDETVTQKIVEAIVGRMESAIRASVSDVMGSKQIADLGVALAYANLVGLSKPAGEIPPILAQIRKALTDRKSAES
jgi:plasmid stability protein